MNIDEHAGRSQNHYMLSNRKALEAYILEHGEPSKKTEEQLALEKIEREHKEEIDTLRKVNREKIVVLVLILSVQWFAIGYVLLRGNFNQTTYFHYIGDSVGVGSFLKSIFLYFLLWWISGLVPSASMFLLMEITLFCIHRKSDLRSNKVFNSVFTFGGCVAFISTYVEMLMLMVLQISNIATIFP